jgi:hypothetical protein
MPDPFVALIITSRPGDVNRKKGKNAGVQKPRGKVPKPAGLSPLDKLREVIL